ncbi:unnamed protein product [Paramecium sonneborni]|uniref:Transmembrane protein n=1 Tax=Paramecium sonneborni TaxID=65129 RepID=A0A8S1R5Z1_9CILI|nr:unnamed protein product [Paramecium sonneborni]
MKKKNYKKSETIQHLCIYDGYFPYGICICNHCEHKGFFCFFCLILRHSHHLNMIITFLEIKDRVKVVIRLIQEIAFQFSLGQREDFANILDDFTQNLWLLEFNNKEYQSKKLQKEITLLKSIPILRQIKKLLIINKQNHIHYFNQIKPLLFQHSNIPRNSYQQNNKSILLLGRILIFSILMSILLKYLLINNNNI